MGTATAKVFLPLAGKPLVVYCLRTLSEVRDLASIQLVVAADQSDRASDVLEEHGPWAVPIHLAAGGAARQDSVAAGLDALDPATDLVIVHDAARPFVARACVEACVEAAQATGAAIVALPARDTVKLANSNGTIAQTLDRNSIWLAQTPQIFRTALLREAIAQARRDGHTATDDAALVERLGVTVHIVPGDPTNQKITTPDDMRWAEWYLRSGREGLAT